MLEFFVSNIIFCFSRDDRDDHYRDRDRKRDHHNDKHDRREKYDGPPENKRIVRENSAGR